MRAQFSEYQLYLRCDFYKESSYTDGKCCLLGGYACCPMVQAVPLMAFADIAACMVRVQPTILTYHQATCRKTGRERKVLNQMYERNMPTSSIAKDFERFCQKGQLPMQGILGFFEFTLISPSDRES